MTRAAGPWTVTQIGSRSVGEKTAWLERKDFELLNPETRGSRWGDWRLIFIAERSGLLRRRERHCRHAEIRAGWPHPGSCPAGDGATAGFLW